MLYADITSDTGWEFQCGESSKEENVKKTTIWNIVKKETRTPEGTVLIPRQDTQSINVAVSLFVQTFYQWRAYCTVIDGRLSPTLWLKQLQAEMTL